MPDPTAFACTASPGFADLLEQLGCSLVLSTYQAGKLVVLSARDGQLVQLPRTFDKPMGMATDGRAGTVERLAVATRSAVVVLASAPELAAGYPGAPGRYDSLFVPTGTYQTGELDLHDMAWGTGPDGSEALWAVNTRFSCLGLVGDGHHFHPMWTPPWVSSLSDDDRCHLNGMALKDGRPAYVTALGQTNTPRGWSPDKLTGGVLFDAAAGEEVFTGLAMPHSPRLFDGRLFVLQSAKGEVAFVDPEAGELTTVLKVPSFLRGMARYGDVVFVG
ncbi:MAG TPA: TIGR03032 family protein, partial [Rubricoccaceae bacterium]